MSVSALMVGASAGALAEVRAPDTMTWGLQDVSSSDAGRTNDANATMHKGRVAQKRKVSLGWKNPDGATVAAILQAFNPEYVFVRYLDPMANAYETREYYVGDRSAPFSQITVGGVTYTNLSFDIIER